MNNGVRVNGKLGIKVVRAAITPGYEGTMIRTCEECKVPCTMDYYRTRDGFSNVCIVCRDRAKTSSPWTEDEVKRLVKASKAVGDLWSARVGELRKDELVKLREFVEAIDRTKDEEEDW